MPLPRALCLALALVSGWTYNSCAENDDGVFRAGASAVDITPPAFPVRVNGMFTERSAEQAADPLHARTLALNNGETTIVFCIVDTCMMPRELIDRAKELASTKSGVATDHMMVSATHTHSAPAAMGCLGSRMDPEYAAWLPDKIAEGIAAAISNLQPARVGWASVDDWTHTHNRRWIRRADKMFADPFGETTVRAHMHPGYESSDVIGPSGPVDPGLSVLAVQTSEGAPLALLANYSQHYFGSPLLSADYFGVFSRNMAKRLGQPSSEGPFVAMMSQGTSGDLMWMDYGAPQQDPTLAEYADEVAGKAMEAYRKIQWHDTVPLGIVEKKLSLQYRVPGAERLAWANDRVQKLTGVLPSSQPDIYAHEAIFLHKKRSTELILHTIRIGDLSIATLPNEVYAITGLKLKAQSPLEMHFNIELANGAEGYIPPPEQFAFGGYTTWPARTAGLEVNAEPQIVETLLSGLEEVSHAPRKTLVDLHGPYAQAVLAAEPIAYWRLNEIEGRIAHNAVGDGITAELNGGAALYLPGVGSGSGCGTDEKLRTSKFSGPNQINRAVHFADGTLDATVALDATQNSVSFWFWLGEPSGASVRAGSLVSFTNGAELTYQQGGDGISRLAYRGGDEHAAPIHGDTRLSMGAWHFAVLVHDTEGVRTYVNGRSGPDIQAPAPTANKLSSIQFAQGFEGKLDEIAVFDRPLAPTEIAGFWASSGIAE